MSLRALFEDDDGPIRQDFSKKAILNYMGSKKQSIAQMAPLIEYRDKFIDCFGGSGMVLYARKPSPLEIYNDKHGGLVAFFRCIADPVLLEQLIDKVKLMPHAREMFYYCKASWEQDQDLVTRAAKWYYLVQTSFAGKAKAWGKITTKAQKVSDKLYDTFEYFYEWHQRFKKVQVENLDWEQMFQVYDDFETVWYLDPPYLDCPTMYQHGMSVDDHRRMCEKIMNLEGFVALSGYDNPVYDEYPWDDKYTWSVDNRVITAEVGMDRQQLRKECLWLKQ